MSIPFAVNGLGRIGRALVRIAQSRASLRLAAVNDLADAPTLARLLARDSVHGRAPFPVAAGPSELVIDGRPVPVFRAPDPAAIPWETADWSGGTAGGGIVVDATGVHLDRATLAGHLRGEVGHAVAAGIVADADRMLAPGLGPELDATRHRVTSLASCTTHCLGLLVEVLDAAFGIERALASEVHGYTVTQNLVDGPRRDRRRGRAAAVNLVPTTTAAPGAVEQLLPHLAGRLAGQAIRVPTPDMALLAVVARTRRDADRDAVVAAFDEAAAGRLRGLLGVVHEPVVSSDLRGDPRSAIVDPALTAGLDRRLVRVAAWYDNEVGYATRLAEHLERIGRTGVAPGPPAAS